MRSLHTHDMGLVAQGARLFGGGGSSSQPSTTTTVQKSDPWAGQQPYLKALFPTAAGLAGLLDPTKTKESQFYGAATPTQAIVGGGDTTTGMPTQAAYNAAKATAQSNFTQTPAGGGYYTFLGVPNQHFTKAQIDALGSQVAPNEYVYHEGTPAGPGFSFPDYQTWAAQNPVTIPGDATSGSTVTTPSDFASSPSAFQYFPGETIAPFSPETQAALDLTTQRALAGSPLQAAGSDQLQKTLSGDYLTAGNPYTDQLVNSVYNTVRTPIDSQFLSGGRYGSAAHEGALGTAVANAIAPQLFDTYNQERSKQLQAGLLAPQYAQNDYYDLSQLGSVGAAKENMNQQLINEAIDRFNFAQQEPFNRLALYNQLVQGNYGGTVNGTTTGLNPVARSSPIASGLGGAASGAAIGSLIPGIGTGIGAVAGGLLGFLGS